MIMDAISPVAVLEPAWKMKFEHVSSNDFTYRSLPVVADTWSRDWNASVKPTPAERAFCSMLFTHSGGSDWNSSM